jgi:hypothetical protein
MTAHGHTATLGTHIGSGQATQGWYAQAKAALNGYWDAGREAVRPLRADAALDMVPQAHVDTTARALCDLSL